jgi:ATP-dependent protease Clp ATPase subunit
MKTNHKRRIYMEGKIKAKASCHFTTHTDTQDGDEVQSTKKWYETAPCGEIQNETLPSPATKSKNTLWKPSAYRKYSMEKYDAYMKLKPKDIKKALEATVVNQEEACKQIAVMMYQHLHGHRCVRVLAGHTGSGKSFIGENLKQLFP